ncbi:MAG: sigma-70 family RNA polymerase sigma factor [Candidatus Obscuribacterales bacterium]|nr:sigma-70 family RNA polymerase sigma factor [Candidatus Obscuribacterales bacterium]
MSKAPAKLDFSKCLEAEAIVKQYMPLVRQIARRYARLAPDQADDLMQMGCMGLLKAVKYYDDGREHKASFKGFAAVYIKGEIRHYLRDHGSLVQVPRRLAEINSKVKQLEEVMTREMEHTPSLEELAARAGCSTQELREAQQSWDNCRHYESLESTDDSEGRDEHRALAEMVADKKYIDELSYSEDRELISQALVSLGERTKKIIEFVYFYDLTQKETAKILGVSEMGVSRSIKSALQKLKEIMLTEIF